VTTWGEWASATTPLESGGLRIATYELGASDGSPVTYLHGYPSSSLDLAPVAARLGDSARMLTLDFPGFGASDKPAGHPYSIHAAADAVEALWGASGVTATMLVSHDYGVSVGQELLARRSDGALDVELTSTVWMNGGLYPDLHRPTLGQQMLLDPETGGDVAAAIDEDLFTGGIAGTWGERRPIDAAEIHEMWLSMERDDGVRIMHELLHYIADRRQHEGRWRDALEQCDLAMRFVWGDLDPVSGAHMIAQVEDRIPQATVLRMADVGHWPPLESPDEVADTITQSIET
jgi:pimeloyl-ACP methyl ester carboxylesterase